MSKIGANAPNRGIAAAELVSSSLENLAGDRRAMPGGAYRDRTDDLKLAKLALSQLS